MGPSPSMVPLPVMVTSVLIAHVDEGGGPGHLDAGDAGGEFGVVFEFFASR